MSQPILRTNGTRLTELNDFQVNSTASSLSLLGNAVPNYGRYMLENLIHMLENFASSTPPPNPMVGQIWFQTYRTTTTPSSKVFKIKVYQGGTSGDPTGWFNVGGATIDSTPPTDPMVGDLWYKPATFNADGSMDQAPGLFYWACTGNGGTNCGWIGTNQLIGQTNAPINPNPSVSRPYEGSLWWMQPEDQLWVYDGEHTGNASPPTKRLDGSNVPAGWTLVGPIFQKGSGTRIEQTQILKTASTNTNILKIYANDILLAVIASEDFTPYNPTDLTGFTTYKLDNNTNTNIESATNIEIKRGINLNIQAISKIHGVSANSERLGNALPSEFLGRTNSGRIATYPATDGDVTLGREGNRWERVYSINYYAGSSTTTSIDYSGMQLINSNLASVLSGGDLFNAPTTMAGFKTAVPNISGVAAAANFSVYAGISTRWYKSCISYIGDSLVDEYAGNPTSFTPPFDSPWSVVVSNGGVNVDGTGDWHHTGIRFSRNGQMLIAGWADEIATSKINALRDKLIDGTVGVGKWGTARTTDITGHIESYGPSINVDGTTNWTYTTRFSATGINEIKNLARDSVEGQYVSLTTSTLPTGNHNIGDNSHRFGTIYALSFNGTYADLAERYHADQHYRPGTIMSFGGIYDVTQSQKINDDDVIGVVSENPSYLMNAAAGRNETHPQIGLIGRVRVRVIGPVKKFDKIITSNIPGVGIAASQTNITDYNIIGRALEDNINDGEKLVLCSIGKK